VKRELSSCIDHRGLQVVETVQGAVTWIALARTDGGCLADRNGMPWNLCRLPVDSEFREYWFGLRIRFEGPRAGDREFRSAAIAVAIDTEGSNRVLLARAEWDPGGTRHAQPHWHLYPVPIMSDDTPLTDGANPESRELLDDAPRIHWAMMARWASLGDQARAHSTESIDTNELALWCGGCLGYVVSQLRYLEAKLPRGRAKFA